MKGLLVLAGVLLISSALQFITWLKGPEMVEKMLEQMSFAGPNGRELTKKTLYNQLGLDHFFIPDLWPFDNRILWRN
ncbi:MAG TPA: hypothetical protein G4O15_11615 [Dehalococcoidia bacterium]|nr:hypothetical protein [Dehalococcoidia bacterium]